MQTLLRMFVLGFLALSAAAQVGEGKGAVDVTKTVAVRVSGSTPEINTLALQAFNAHGLYRLVATGFTYDIRFTALGATQVRVDITQSPGNTPVAAQVASGATLRQAFFRAADAAVE